MSADKVKLILVDDHSLLRQSLADRLNAEIDFDVVAQLESADDAVRTVVELRPDVVLMDIDMPGVTSFDAAEQINSRRPETRIIFLSAFFNDRYIEQALRVEAKGYLIKSSTMSTVIKAIRQVAQGRVYFSDEVRDRIVVDAKGIRLSPKAPQTRVSTLTPRELEVLRYLARGLSKKEIAQTMHISAKTVEGHTEKVMNKLDIHDRVELARFAIREGLVEA
ncbi:MAG: response regulator [Phycisphaera sp.]|nr:response regulator [Phycisphaera sp.]